LTSGDRALQPPGARGSGDRRGGFMAVGEESPGSKE